MTIARRLARPMLASIFVSGGIETLRNPGPSAAVAGDVAQDVADALPVELPRDSEQLVKIDAAAKLVGGLLLASSGRFARIGALVCAATLVPTTYAAHRFWEETDPDVKAQQQVHFFKNVGLFGGLLIAALDTDGRPSLPYLAKQGAASVGDKAGDLVDRAAELAGDIGDRAGDILPG